MPVTKNQLQAAINAGDHEKVERLGVRKLFEMSGMKVEELRPIVQILSRDELLALFDENIDKKEAKSLAGQLRKLVREEKWDEAKSIAVKIIGIADVRDKALKVLGQAAHRPITDSEKLQELIEKSEHVEAMELIERRLKEWLGLEDGEIEDIIHIFFDDQNNAVPYFKNAEKKKGEKAKQSRQIPDHISAAIEPEDWESVVKKAIELASLDEKTDKEELQRVVRTAMALNEYESFEEDEKLAVDFEEIKKITKKEGKPVLDDEEIAEIAAAMDETGRKTLLANSLYISKEKQKQQKKWLEALKNEQKKKSPDLQKLTEIALKILSIDEKGGHKEAFKQLDTFKKERREGIFALTLDAIEQAINNADWEKVIEEIKKWQKLEPASRKQSRLKKRESGKDEDEMNETIINAEQLKEWEMATDERKKEMLQNKIMSIADQKLSSEQAEGIAVNLTEDEAKQLFINGLYLRGIKQKKLSAHMKTLEKEHQKDEPDVQKIITLCLQMLAIKLPLLARRTKHYEARLRLEEMLAKLTSEVEEAEDPPPPEIPGVFQPPDSDMDLKTAEKMRKKQLEKAERPASKIKKGEMTRRQLIMGGAALAALAMGDLLLEELRKPPKKTEFARDLDEAFENLGEWSSKIDWGKLSENAEDAETDSEIARLTREANEKIKAKGGVLDRNTDMYIFKNMEPYILDSPLIELEPMDEFHWIDEDDKKRPYRLKKIVAEAMYRVHEKMKKDGLNGIKINSAFREHGHQMKLIERFKAGDPEILSVGPPGGGGHGMGQAIDVQNYDEAMPYLAEEGFKWLGPADKVHFNYGIPTHQSLKTMAAEELIKMTGDVQKFMNDPDGYYQEYVKGFGHEATKKAGKAIRGAKKWLKRVDLNPFD